MAGGGFTDGGGNLKRAHLYEHRITGYFIAACIVAALGGSLFGYDLGVSGQFSFAFLCMSLSFFWVFFLLYLYDYEHMKI